ncbi:MAG: MBL fold metallo-hydrolase, partial [Chitinophagia bacterium]|nr:MBL fold metallo-hydrolase [Chitinophagia bacterium]
MIKVTFLGTGTSQGVPIIGCKCEVCTSPNPKDTRLRCSVWVQTPEASLVIDTGPDFRTQMLRAGIEKIDAVLFTHSHKDHLAGLDDIRAYNYLQNKPIPVYATLETQAVLRLEYNYIFENASYPGVPQIEMHTINGDAPFTINGLTITPIKVLHYKMEVLGFRIGNFTYITDVNYISDAELAKTAGSEVLVLTALR